MSRLHLRPLDTLFFRDGRPYRQGEDGQSHIPSLFPPSPRTLVGAVRAAYARSLGWNGHGKWSPEIAASLGDGDDLGPLDFTGPLLHHGEHGVLLPAPANLLGKVVLDEDDTLVVRTPVTLVPAKGIGVTTDLGDVALPRAPTDGIEGRKSLEGWWMTRSGLEAILAGRTPDSQTLIHPDKLYRREPRVGIKRDPGSRTTPEQALYSPLHVRLQRNVDLLLYAAGLPPAAASLRQPIPIGGEGRACWIELQEGRAADALPACPMIAPVQDVVRYSIHLLTPLCTAHAPRLGEAFLDLPGKVVSACLPRPVRLGGWRHGEGPLAMMPHLATGSVVFMQAGAETGSAIAAAHGSRRGEYTRFGFGWIAIGIWKPSLGDGT